MDSRRVKNKAGTRKMAALKKPVNFSNSYSKKNTKN